MTNPLACSQCSRFLHPFVFCYDENLPQLRSYVLHIARFFCCYGMKCEEREWKTKLQVVLIESHVTRCSADFFPQFSTSSSTSFSLRAFNSIFIFIFDFFIYFSHVLVVDFSSRSLSTLQCSSIDNFSRFMSCSLALLSITHLRDSLRWN